ncbi:MAG TPA: hypothetical protein PK411_03360 [Mesotoga infera]|jgi:hypothetical protein|nr:hypothetical protein [Mesotoga sp.]NLI06225.1 hypothetical protein [Thermotogaceae bacterium]HNS67933.1 hypothetical protein [Mesotoga infera]HOI33959.1 hypothetical protein [Mesotoga infera]HON27363.1 hypothetical protein [Mesotoga infera]
MRRSAFIIIFIVIFLISSCVRISSASLRYLRFTFSPWESFLEIVPGVKLSLEGAEKTATLSYAVQRLSGDSLLLVFEEDRSLSGIVMELSHELLGVEVSQVLMVQPLLRDGAFSLADSGYEFSVSRDALETVVRFTQLPYCLLISRADALYFAQHLPGKYLLEGDLLYHIGPNWIPSHSGVYLGVDREAVMSNENYGFNDGETFADSYPYQTHGFNLIEEGVFVFPNDLDGSKYVNLFNYDTYSSRWLKYWASAFTGPRRYVGELTGEQRRKISRYLYRVSDNGALWSVGLAWSGYRDLPFTKRDLYSCVGIVEKAYESAGANIVPFWDDWFYLNSFEEFCRTIAIPSISEYEGNTIEFRVNTLLADWQYVGSTAWYIPEFAWVWRSTAEVELVDSPGTLTKEGDHCIYNWTPTQPGMYKVTFRFHGLFEGHSVEKSHTLEINVLQKR